jgi:hypothetical protein
MVLGLSLPYFTAFHVVLSLVGIAAGFVVLVGLFNSKSSSGWTKLFLATTILTSVTGYFFPADRILPSHIVGAVSLAILAVAVIALYRYRLQRAWRWAYAIAAVASLYLNVFVAVAQAFQKISPLHTLAPTQAEPPFVVAQAAVLLAFVATGVFAVRRFHPVTGPGALRPA